MKVYIYLQIKPPQEVQFHSPFREIFKSKGYQCFDADQDSDSFLISQGLSFMKEAEEVVIHLSVKKPTLPGSIVHFFEVLRKVKTPVFIVCEGGNEMIEKMLKLLKRDVNFTSTEEEVLSHFEHYLSSK